MRPAHGATVVAAVVNPDLHPPRARPERLAGAQASLNPPATEGPPGKPGRKQRGSPQCHSVCPANRRSPLASAMGARRPEARRRSRAVPIVRRAARGRKA